MSTVDTIEQPSTEAIPAPRRHYASVVTGALLVVIGALWLFDAVDLVELRAELVLPSILMVIGLALIVGAFDGPHPGLVVAGVFVTLAALWVALAPPNAFHGGIGERDVRITDQADLASRYDVGLGELRLDLSELALTESAVVEATVGAGDFTVTVPPDVLVDITASAGAGEVDLFGEHGEGISVTRTYTSEGFDTARVTLTLDLDVSAGNIEVDR